MDWFAAQGICTYAALEDWELPDFEQRFSGNRRIAGLRAPPVAIYRATSTMRLFDLTDPPEISAPVVVDTDVPFGWRAPRPAGRCQYLFLRDGEC